MKASRTETSALMFRRREPVFREHGGKMALPSKGRSIPRGVSKSFSLPTDVPSIKSQVLTTASLQRRRRRPRRPARSSSGRRRSSYRLSRRFSAISAQVSTSNRTVSHILRDRGDLIPPQRFLIQLSHFPGHRIASGPPRTNKSSSRAHSRRSGRIDLIYRACHSKYHKHVAASRRYPGAHRSGSPRS